MSATLEATLHEYRLFGLPLRSAIALPELDRCDHDAADAIEISMGMVPQLPGGEDNPHWLATTSDGAILSVPDVARFRIHDGRRITVDADPMASDRNVRLFLLGSAMGALLHQRGILPLHANAIEIDGRAIAFLGHSGAGKSTLAAAFHDRGHRILSDDVCAVTPEGDGFVAQPGIPRLRLWRDAVERTGRETDCYERAFDSLDKYTVRTDARSRAEALPLGAIFLLVRHEGDGPAEIRRLGGAAAIQALMENTYRGGFIATTGNARAHFECCLQLSRGVPVLQLSRPWDAARIDETLTQIVAELRATAAEAAVSPPTA